VISSDCARRGLARLVEEGCDTSGYCLRSRRCARTRFGECRRACSLDAQGISRQATDLRPGASRGEGLPGYGSIGTRKEMIQYLTAALPIVRSYLKALRRLRPPAQLKGMHDMFVSDETSQLALMVRFIATFKAVTNAEFPLVATQWGASARAISRDETTLLLNLQLPRCA
jgi:hypothetical protein